MCLFRGKVWLFTLTLILFYWISSIILKMRPSEVLRSEVSLCVKWLQSYLPTSSSFVHILGKSYSPYSVLSTVPQGCTSRSLLFSASLMNFVLNYSKCLLFADDLKIHGDIKSVKVCKSLQADTDSAQKWCCKNYTFIKLRLYISQVRPAVSILFLCQWHFSRIWGHRPDDGGSKVLWNVGKFLPDYTVLQPRR
jgi:hypothetical protein